MDAGGGWGWGDGRSRYLGGWVGRRIMRGNISAWRGTLGFPRAADKSSVRREGSSLHNVVCSALPTLHLILMDAARNSQPGRSCQCDGGFGCGDQELHATLRGALAPWQLSFGVLAETKTKTIVVIIITIIIYGNRLRSTSYPRPPPWIITQQQCQTAQLLTSFPSAFSSGRFPRAECSHLLS